jgi:hypothetical protein
MMKRVKYGKVSAVYDQRYKSGGPAGIAESLQELACRVKAHTTTSPEPMKRIWPESIWRDDFTLDERGGFCGM